MLPGTSERVPLNTSACSNQQIRRDTEENIAHYRHAGRSAIDRRLQELEQEWDVERVLETNAATACIVGVTLGLTVNRKWFLLPGIVGAFLLQHALHGWCPPLPVFRAMGRRTQREIDEERFALKVLRGDFSTAGAGSVGDVGATQELVASVRGG